VAVKKIVDASAILLEDAGKQKEEDPIFVPVFVCEHNLSHT
jgi:hypothetical protein